MMPGALVSELNSLGVREKAQLLERLKQVDYATFDMDGTILRPGLLVFDVMMAAFRENENPDKLKELEASFKAYREVPFKDSYLKFLSLLKGEDKMMLKQVAKMELEAKAYPYAKLVIKKLKEEYAIRPYLISLTTEFIAELAEASFGFEDSFSVDCISRNVGGRELFTGETLTELGKPSPMKGNLFREFRKQVGDGEFICFFDSEDDMEVVQNAALAVGVNLSPELKRHPKVDLLLDGTDPWKSFYEML